MTTLLGGESKKGLKTSHPHAVNPLFSTGTSGHFCFCCWMFMILHNITRLQSFINSRICERFPATVARTNLQCCRRIWKTTAISTWKFCLVGIYKLHKSVVMIFLDVIDSCPQKRRFSQVKINRLQVTEFGANQKQAW